MFILCVHRIDYKWARTKSFVMNLNVIGKYSDGNLFLKLTFTSFFSFQNDQILLFGFANMHCPLCRAYFFLSFGYKNIK